MATPKTSVKISGDGSIVIPEKFRKALNLNNGQSVTLRQQGQGLLIENTEKVTLRARAEMLVRQAKHEAAHSASTMTEDEAWQEFNAAAQALRKALRTRKAK